MNDYLLITTISGYRDEVRKKDRIRIILFILVLPILVILLILSAGGLLFDRNYRKEYMKTVDALLAIEFNSEKFCRSLGVFVSYNKNIMINLQELKMDTEEETIKEIVECIEHEDLHKGISNVTNTIGDDHWAIDGMMNNNLDWIGAW